MKKLLSILLAALILPVVGTETVNADATDMTTKAACQLGALVTKGTVKTAKFVAKDPYARGVVTGLALYIPVRYAVNKLSPLVKYFRAAKRGTYKVVTNPVCTALMASAITYKLTR
ncbi:MAG TPA: hypothetical protein QGF02_01630 [Candidatus Babeliales bacterium]|nr:hypothetical protein [Candidatus Babeliales bacterium]